ncbi:hypothetical protein [Micromonospora radicis]|uniref:Uncharacterized protein n=1 Tax=Micromonospora radicis TaxID=1894971 RepID=A0A418MYG0_9ACTN|nr:hypothetical protein [Micromonospora radicis]RIV40218.1 hypothetical protein D2L64_04995 [Micromonospora radicis]
MRHLLFTVEAAGGRAPTLDNIGRLAVGAARRGDADPSTAVRGSVGGRSDGRTGAGRVPG